MRHSLLNSNPDNEVPLKAINLGLFLHRTNGRVPGELKPKNAKWGLSTAHATERERGNTLPC